MCSSSTPRGSLSCTTAWAAFLLFVVLTCPTVYFGSKHNFTDAGGGKHTCTTTKLFGYRDVWCYTKGARDQLGGDECHCPRHTIWHQQVSNPYVNPPTYAVADGAFGMWITAFFLYLSVCIMSTLLSQPNFKALVIMRLQLLDVLLMVAALVAFFLNIFAVIYLAVELPAAVVTDGFLTCPRGQTSVCDTIWGHNAQQHIIWGPMGWLAALFATIPGIAALVYANKVFMGASDDTVVEDEDEDKPLNDDAAGGYGSTDV